MARQFGGPGGYGHLPDPPGHLVSGFGLLRAAGSAQTPTSALLTPPDVMDQGETSACVGHATSGACQTSFRAAGKPLPFAPSPLGIYLLARCIDRQRNANGTLPALVDGGSMPNQAMRGIAEWGVVPMGGPTPDGRRSDADPAVINREPTLQLLEDGSQLELTGYYRIDSVGAARVSDLRKALAAGHAVCFAVQVDDTFEGWSGGEPLGAPDPGRILGAHYLYAYGYRTSGGATIVRFRNSWGSTWGIDGDGDANEAFVAGMSDIYVMAVERTAPVAGGNA
jgi:hypothetical protein